MTCLNHTWTPIPGETARYSCTCDATGYRHRSGEIREHRRRVDITRKATVRARGGGDGRVAALIREDFDAGRERDA